MNSLRRAGMVSLSLTTLAALLLAPLSPARAEYPERPIRLVLPFPAGGAVDFVTRLVAERMASEIGGSIVIENKAGAGGIIATETVAKSAPDGYTLLITTPNHTINAALHAKLSYDTEKDFIPISIAAEVPELLVSNPAAPFDTFAGFVDYAKKNSGKLNYASAGNGTLPHITMELLLKQGGLRVAHVPYRGAAPAMTDLLAGHVQLKLDTYATSHPHVASGKLKALAFASRKRSPLMPNLPTIAEMGYPGYEGILWIGLLAPAKTPQPVVDKLAAVVAKTMKAPALVARLQRDGVDSVGGDPAAFRTQITREIAQWRDVIKAANISIR
jgi:tripartite-type tricarboxylate transporter receptor subunit TctC